MRIRPLITSIILLATVCGAALAQTAPTTQEGRRVFVTMERQVVSLGNPIPVNIVYRNGDEREWRIARPDTSMGTHVRYILTAETDLRYAKGYGLGKVRVAETILPNGQLMTAQVAPAEVDLHIRPGEDYRFATDLEAMWSGHICPGTWSVWFFDEKQGFETSRLDFRVEFNKESVPAMLSLVGESNRNPYQRKMYAQWLAKLKPGFTVSLPKDEGEVADDAKQRGAANAAAIAEFRGWWEKNRDTPEVEKRLRDINAQSEKDTLEELDRFKAARNAP